MILNTRESRALARTFGLLAEGLGEREVRQRVGESLLDLLAADQFASFVWDGSEHRFGAGLWINMDSANLANYERWYQYHDPITFGLQARRHATAVSEVMPHSRLVRTEFFNDFLARDGLHWGINLHAFDGHRALGDLRIWRARHRRDFEAHDKALLGLLEPAFVAALRRAQAGATPPVVPQGLSEREREVMALVAAGRTDKEIARTLGIGVPSVRTYLRRLADKTGARHRAGIAALMGSLPRG